MGFLRPTPPYGKLRGRSTYLLLFLTYLAEKITTDMATPGWALYRARINLLNWKLWNLLKSQFKNITHISDIQFGNFIDSLLWYLAGSNLEYKQFGSIYVCYDRHIPLPPPLSPPTNGPPLGCSKLYIWRSYPTYIRPNLFIFKVWASQVP